MRKLFILAFCCMSVVYAGLKEDIEEKFNECVNASKSRMHEYCDEYTAGCFKYYDDELSTYKWESVTRKAYCFMEFSEKYEDILMRQCENKKKDECKKLAHIIVNVYGVNSIDSAEDSKNLKSAINNLLTLCSSTECYEIAELFGLTHEISQPFLEKACKENVDDACYAIGK